MRSVLIADRDVEFAENLAGLLSMKGFHTIVCPGPFPPRLRCIRCDVGYCPLTEGADAMVYEAELVALRKRRQPVFVSAMPNAESIK